MTKYNFYVRLKGSSAPWELQETVECRSQEEADWGVKADAFDWFQGECGDEDLKLAKKWNDKFRAMYPNLNPDEWEEDAMSCYYDDVISRMEFCAIAV